MGYLVGIEVSLAGLDFQPVALPKVAADVLEGG